MCADFSCRHYLADGGTQVRTQLPLRLCWAKRQIGSIPPVVPLAITRTDGPWAHTSDDSYIYQLSLVFATAILNLLPTSRPTRCRRAPQRGRPRFSSDPACAPPAHMLPSPLRETELTRCDAHFSLKAELCFHWVVKS